MTQSSPGSFFSGPDRLEVLQAFGRPVRLGTLEELKRSDAERVCAAIQARDIAGAKGRLGLLQAIHGALITTYLEWAYAILAFTARRHTEATEREMSRRTFQAWRKGLSPLPPDCREEAVTCLVELLDPKRVGASTIEAFRASPANVMAARLNEAPARAFAALQKALDGGDIPGALRHFDDYLKCARDRHDLIGRFVALYAGELTVSNGQRVAISLVQESLESCAVLEGMWAFVANSRPEELVLMLAEHLRAHFSGPGREGGVEIVEEKDRYRLIFAPCGTGGVMRQQEVPGLKLLPEATPETWHRTGQVPTYCAHCAKNELTSIKRFGYPAWVTEFDPDPKKPCGWTVYKDPKLVPDSYFERLGIKRK